MKDIVKFCKIHHSDIESAHMFIDKVYIKFADAIAENKLTNINKIKEIAKLFQKIEDMDAEGYTIHDGFWYA